jgi:hypothetical protein
MVLTSSVHNRGQLPHIRCRLCPAESTLPALRVNCVEKGLNVKATRTYTSRVILIQGAGSLRRKSSSIESYSKSSA